MDHNYTVHVFREGVLRTSSEKYDLDNLDSVSHVTNHCLQEAHSKNFGRFEDGNEMFFAEFSKQVPYTTQYTHSAHHSNLKIHH